MEGKNLENNILYQEWKEAQEHIMKFDEMILDIRKYGFSLVTVLLGASGFLYKSTGIGGMTVLGIFTALLILTFGLFLIDRYHEVFLRGAVARAMDLEGRLGIGLSSTITGISNAAHTATWGTSLYVLLAAANTFLVLGAVSPERGFQTAACVLGGICSVAIVCYHYQTKTDMLTKKKHKKAAS